MKKLYSFRVLTTKSLALATAFLFACSNDDTPTPPPSGPDSDDPGVEVAATPIKSLKATIGEETVTATVDDEQKQASLNFDYAEDFTSVTLAVETNTGWKVQAPAELDGIDLSTDPSITFASDDDQTMTYDLVLATNANPIDVSKLSVAGASVSISPDNASRIIITFDANASTTVEITFADGALKEGASISGMSGNILTLAFGATTEQEVSVMINGKEHKYTFVLEMPALADEFLKKLKTVGDFIDKTAEYAFASKYDYIKVYNATTLNNMPGATNGKGEDGSSTSEPVHWTNNSSLEVQEAAMRCLGDCTDADFTQTVTGVNFTIVTVDKSKVSGKIVASSEDRGFSIDGSEGLIAMSGNVVVREDQKFRNNLIAVGGTTLANSLSWSTAFRTAIAFDKDGTIHFVLAGLDDTDNSIRQLPFCEDQTDHNAVLSDNERDKYYYGANYKNKFLASWEFDMQSVATAHMLMILNGEAKGWRWGLLNDGNSSSPGNATAYNARARRTFIGETEDKIVFATETGDGVLMSQGGRVLQVAGCTNATATSRHDGWMNVADTNGGSTEYYPSIYVDGVNVSGGASSTCPLCYKIVYNAK